MVVAKLAKLTKGNTNMNKAFWILTRDRAIRTVGQVAIAAITTSGIVNAFEINWTELAGIVLLAGLASVLSSIAFPSQELKVAKGIL
jgi:hypothetical protein